VKLAFILDPLDTLKPYKDSSVAMLQEAARRGHDLNVLGMRDMWLRGETAMGAARRLTLTGREPDWFELGDAESIPLADFDAMLHRKDPPFDQEYLYSTYLLELAERQGARVINSPRAVRDYNEKLAILRFPRFIPPTLVTSDPGLIRRFVGEQRDVILKPLDAMGGASVFHVHPQDRNLSVILETMTRHSRRTVMAQRFVPAIAQGDKRILLIDGEPVPYLLARIPAPGETRGNLAAGARGEARELTMRDREIAGALGPVLAREGLFLVGLDVIGDFLTEINVTSPTGFREITDQTGFDVAGMFMDALERRASGGS
jgi:glutathione synthase